MLQVTDQRTLRKLLRRIDELAVVKNILIDVAEGMPTDSSATITILLTDNRKVKENQHMTALLQEIQEYLAVGNKEAASKTAKRVLEAEPAKDGGKPASSDGQR